MKKTKLIFVIFLLLIFIGASAAFCQTDFKVGYIDVSKIFDQYEKTKESDKVLEAELNKRQGERDKLLNEVKRMRDELELLSEDAKKKKQGAIDEKVKDLDEFDRKAKDELKKERDVLMRDILKEIDDVIADYAKTNGYTLIFNDRVLLYGNETMDLTDEIIKILNKKYKRSDK